MADVKPFRALRYAVPSDDVVAPPYDVIDAAARDAYRARDPHNVAHLTLNVPDYYANQTQRDRVVELADYLAGKLETQRPDEASAARILRELVRHQRLG